MVNGKANGKLISKACSEVKKLWSCTAGPDHTLVTQQRRPLTLEISIITETSFWVLTVSQHRVSSRNRSGLEHARVVGSTRKSCENGSNNKLIIRTTYIVPLFSCCCYCSELTNHNHWTTTISTAAASTSPTLQPSALHHHHCCEHLCRMKGLFAVVLLCVPVFVSDEMSDDISCKQCEWR